MSDGGDSEDDDAAGAGTLSFIDVVSCGLAAALLLFLVYTVLPHMGRSGSVRASVMTVHAPAGFERNTAGLARDEKSAKLPITIMAVGVPVTASQAESIAWNGLPRDCRTHVVHTATQVLFVASCIKGVPSDGELSRNDEVSLGYTGDGQDARPLRVDATLFVGGGAPFRADCRLPDGDVRRFAVFVPSARKCLVRVHGDIAAP